MFFFTSDEEEITTSQDYPQHSQPTAQSLSSECIDLTMMPSSDDDDETRLLLEYHSWRYNGPQKSIYSTTAEESSASGSSVTQPPSKRTRIFDHPGHVEIPSVPPPLPSNYEIIQEIPGVPPRIDCGAHVVFPYDGEVFSKRTQRPMGFLQSNGYYQLQLHGRKILLHRFMYEVCHRVELGPQDMIDHIDHNKQNNCITNLRRTNGSGNNQNRPQPRRRKNNLPRGVNKSTCGRFTASITINGKPEYLGTFLTPKAASDAYKRAARLANRTRGTNFYLDDQ